MQAELIALRLIHILGGIFWVGSAIFVSLFLFPALSQAGSAAGQVMAALQRRRMFIALPLGAVLTILSGLRLMWITSGGFSSSYFAAPAGRTFSMAAGASIVAFLIGLAVARPASMRVGQLTQALATAGTPGERATVEGELQVVRRRAALAGSIVLLLLVLAAAGMGVARYV